MLLVGFCALLAVLRVLLAGFCVSLDALLFSPSTSQMRALWLFMGYGKHFGRMFTSTHPRLLK